jgi:hypothetical protein
MGRTHYVMNATVRLKAVGKLLGRRIQSDLLMEKESAQVASSFNLWDWPHWPTWAVK